MCVPISVISSSDPWSIFMKSCSTIWPRNCRLPHSRHDIGQEFPKPGSRRCLAVLLRHSSILRSKSAPRRLKCASDTTLAVSYPSFSSTITRHSPRKLATFLYSAYPPACTFDFRSSTRPKTRHRPLTGNCCWRGPPNPLKKATRRRNAPPRVG